MTIDRRKFLSASLALGAASLAVEDALAAQGTSPDSGGAADPLVEKVAQAALTMQRLSWEQGILAQGFLELGQDEMVIRMARSALIHATPDGRMAALGGSTTDSGMGGPAYWQAAQQTGDPALKKGVEAMLDYFLKRAGRAADGTLYHTSNVPAMWSDTFNTTAPFFAAAGRFDDAIRQIDGCHKRLWSPEKKLLAHIWDDRQRKFTDPAFWGVGCGWAASAITRVIRALPPQRQADRDRLAAMLKSLIDGCLAHQRPDGLFHNIVDRPDTFVEVNLAQMLAFAIYASVQGGWLAEDYLKAADKMRTAARAKVDRYGFVQDVCGAPHFDAPGIAPEGQAAFLMMEAAARKLGRS